MKQFVNIHDWLDNNPSEQDLSRVIEFINKNVRHQMKKDLTKKRSDLKKMNRLISNLNEVGFKPTKDMNDKYAEKVKEVETLTLELDVPGQKENESEKVSKK